MLLLGGRCIVQNYGGSIPSLSDPSELAYVSEVGGGTAIDTGTIAPASGSLLAVIFQSRSDVSRNHNSISTSGLTNLGSWTKAGDIIQDNVAGDRWIRTSIWWAKFSGAAGSGTLTGTLSGNPVTSALQVYQFTGYDTADPVPSAAVGTAANRSGTSITVTPAATPTTDSCLLVGFTEFSTVAGFSPSSGFTELRDAVVSTTVFYGQYKRGSVTAGGITISGGLNNTPRTAVVVEIRRATS